MDLGTTVGAPDTADGGSGDDASRTWGAADHVGPVRSAPRVRRPRAGWESLTPTELEVVAQVATGRSNAEIGACLLVSPGTVRTHLRSVFAKIGVTSRTELAARAAADRRSPSADVHDVDDIGAGPWHEHSVSTPTGAARSPHDRHGPGDHAPVLGRGDRPGP